MPMIVGETAPEPVAVEDLARQAIATALHDAACPSGPRCGDSPTTWDARWFKTAKVAVEALTKAQLLGGRILAAPTSPSEPAVKIDGQTITVEWLKHCGWQDADIATALADRDHSDCDMTPEGWDCSDGDGNRLHPLHDEVDEVAALVMFVLERLPSVSVGPVPSTPRVWAMPEIPEDVKAVRNRHGVRLSRVARSSSGGPIWEDEVGHWVSERELIAELGPLAEVEETNDGQ